MARDSAAFAPLTSPGFRWFFVGRLVSMVGISMAPIALAFAVLDLTGSAGDLGLVLAARSIPLILFLLVGGVVADRFSRSVVLTVSHLGAAATQGTVAILLLTGSPSLPTLIALEFVNGSVSAFTFPAMQGVIPLVTPAGALQQANALMSFARSAATMAGPSLAALLVITAGSGWAIAGDAVSYLFAAFCMSRLRLGAVVSEGRSVLADLRVGWREFSSRTWLWVVVAAFCLINLIQAGVVSTLGPAIAATSELGKAGWGLYLSAEAVGLFAISLLLLRLRLRYPVRAGILGCLLLAPPMFLLGVGPTVWPMVALGFLAGAGVEVFEIGWQTAYQEHIPTEALSRVASYDALGSFVATPIGQIVAGPLAGWLGTEQVVLGGAVLTVVTLLLVLLSSSVRNLRRVDPDPVMIAPTG